MLVDFSHTVVHFIESVFKCPNPTGVRPYGSRDSIGYGFRALVNSRVQLFFLALIDRRTVVSCFTFYSPLFLMMLLLMLFPVFDDVAICASGSSCQHTRSMPKEKEKD
ncbi:hypothetical protein LXL04_031524 [Taraxacum kok-saghyz]